MERSQPSLAKIYLFESVDNLSLFLLFIFVVLIPFEFATKLPYGRTILFYLGIILAFLFLLKISLNGYRIKINKLPIFLLFLWLGWAAFSIFWAEDTGRSLRRIIDIFEGLLFVIIFINLITSEKKMKIVLTTFYFSTVIISLYLIFSAKIISFDRVVLIQGENPNFFGRNIAIGFLIGLFFLIQNKNISVKIVHIISITLLSAVIIRLFSRGIWLALGVSLLFSFLFYFKRIFADRKNLVLFPLILSIIVILFTFLLTEWGLRRIERTFIKDERLTYGTRRIEVWSVAVKIYLEHPIIGVGVNNFFNTFPDYIYSEEIEKKLLVTDLEGKDAHNVFIGILCELGIIGIIPFTIFLATIFIQIRRIKNHKFSLLAFMIFVFIFISLFFNTFQN